MNNETVEIQVEKILVDRNDRQVFDIHALKELSDSIAEHGVLQHLIVRPHKNNGGHYELVAGERRLRAGMKAGLRTVPCAVMDMDDQTASEIMLIENLQRKDIHPLDEAASFLRLTEQKMLPKTIALKIGKRTHYVKERLSLNNLDPEVAQIFRQNEMQLGHALILALFTHDQQVDAVESVMQNDNGFAYFGNPVDLKRFMNREILLKLSEALFDPDDAKLDKKAGACSTCPKQTGANKELFACVTQEAKCLDRTCFVKKNNKFIEIQNKQLLKQFSKSNLEECVTITDDSYSYRDDELNCNEWKPADQADECPHITLGAGSGRNSDYTPQVQMVCLNKKCSVHFEKQESSRPSEIPENETKVEAVKRKMGKRRAKEKVKDYHAARLDYQEAIYASKNDVINEWELAFIVNKLCWNAPDYLAELAIETGFKQEGEIIGWNERPTFVKYLKRKGPAVMFMFIRQLIARENLQPDNKWIDSKPLNDNYLLQQGKSLDLDFKPFLKTHQDARKETYVAQNKALKELEKKEKAKADKITSLIQNAKVEYPFLHEVINSADRSAILEKQTVETLSKMTFRLGLKRKKDGDVAYYVDTIKEGLDAMLIQPESSLLSE